MSAHKSVKDLPEGGEHFDESKAALVKNFIGVVGVICLTATLVLLFFGGMFGEGGQWAADNASYSYLFAVTFFLTLGMGGLFWTILHHATNSGWGIVVRRQMENIAGMIPWIFALMIPFWFPAVRDDLFEWEVKVRALIAETQAHLGEHFEEEHAAWEAKRDAVDSGIQERADLLTGLTERGATEGERVAVQEQMADLDAELARVLKKEPTEKSVFKHAMHAKDPVLTDKYFLFFEGTYVRLALYAIVFITIVYLLRKWSIATDKTGDVRYFLRSRYWSCFFILPFAVGFTFLVIDFLMALNYLWFSTMWGVYLFAGAALSSMALLIVVVTILRGLGYLQEVVTMEHYHLMGKLLLAFCIFWAYISFSQFFLIWYANITEETVFFLLRNSGGWNAVSLLLVVGHFFLPFVVLLWRPVKKVPLALAAVGAWILIMHIVDIYWIVMPERTPSLTAGTGQPGLFDPRAILLDILAFVGVGGTLVYLFINNLKRSSLYPCGDPRLQESMSVVN